MTQDVTLVKVTDHSGEDKINVQTVVDVDDKDAPTLLTEHVTYNIA